MEKDLTNPVSLPVVLTSEGNEFQEIHFVDSGSGLPLAMNIIDLNITTQQINNQETVACQDSMSAESDQVSLSDKMIGEANELNNAKLNLNQNLKEFSEESGNKENSTLNILTAEEIVHSEPVNKSSMIEDNESEHTYVIGPANENQEKGFSEKPSQLVPVLENKKTRNLFENFEPCKEMERDKLIDNSENSDEVISDRDNGDSEMGMLEDALKSDCLKTKLSVKLVPLDNKTLSMYQKIGKTKKSTQSKSPEEKVLICKKEVKIVRGKKKKRKVSVQLLREINKQPAKRFSKVPEAKKLWKKIEKMEKTGVNWKKRQGRRAIEGEFPCNLCDYVAKQKSHLQAHRSVHVKQWKTCSFCKFQSRSETKMMEHEARHTGDKPFKCKHEGCDYAGVCKGDLTKHQRKHADDKPFKCPHCDFGTKWPRNIQHHLLTHTDERPYVCKQCGYAFKRQSDLNYHMYRHSDIKPIKCEQCEFRCKTNFEIKCHMLKHSNIRYFKCPHPGCKQETKTKSDLTKHMKVHCKTLDFVCDLCGKGFKTKGSMKKHQLRHSDERPWKCDLCNRRFKIKPALRNHINMHAGYKPHSCEVCGMLFASLSNKRTHMRVHSSKDRSLKCPICPYLGKTQDHILSHIGTMHGSQYAYFCEICKKPFKRYHLLQVHYPRCHTKEEMAFMESTFQLNIQAIKSEAIDEISKSELAKRNADLNWDCIVIKDERCDPEEDQSNTNEDSKMEQNQNNNERNSEGVEQVNGQLDINGQNSILEDPKTDFKTADLEYLNKSNESHKPAILALYDGFRLPLATTGFHFNFIKKGKKTKAWFMDQNLMDETAKKRHQTYLKRKQEEVLYGYYSSKRRKRTTGKTSLSNGPAERSRRKNITNCFSKNSNAETTGSMKKTMPKIVISSGSSQTQRVEAEKLLNISIKKSMSEFKKSKANSHPDQRSHSSGKSISLKKQDTEDYVEIPKKRTITEKRVENHTVHKQNCNSKIDKNSNVKSSLTSKSVTQKVKSGQKPVQGQLSTIRKTDKVRGKAAGRKPKPKVPGRNLTKSNEKHGRKQNLSDNKISVQTKKLKEKPQQNASKTQLAKAKPGRKPKADPSMSIAAQKPKGKPGRKPKTNDGNFVTPLPKGKAGKKPKTVKKLSKISSAKLKGKKSKGSKATTNLKVKLTKPKGKPGRKPKGTSIVQVIKQEAVDDFDHITSAIDTLIENQITSYNAETTVSQDVSLSCNFENAATFNTDGGQATPANAHLVDNSKQVNSSLSDRIKTSKRKSTKESDKYPGNHNQPSNSQPTDLTNQVVMADSDASDYVVYPDKPVKNSHLGKRKTGKRSSTNEKEDTNTDDDVTKKRKFFTNKGITNSLKNIQRPNLYSTLLQNLTSAASTTSNGSQVIDHSNQMSAKPSHKRLTSVQNLPTDMLKKINFSYKDDGIPIKRGKKMPPQAEVVIDNAEEMDSQDAVYPVSLQTIANMDYNEPGSPVTIKEEFTDDVNESENGSHNGKGSCQLNEDENNSLVDKNIEEDSSVVSFCDDVTAMRNSFHVQIDSNFMGSVVSADQINSFGETGELNICEPSPVNHLGITIQNSVASTCTESPVGDSSQVSNRNVVVQLIEPLDDNREIFSRAVDGLAEDQSLNDDTTEMSDNSSPVKKEPMEKDL